jgi:transposase InsO family protein
MARPPKPPSQTWKAFLRNHAEAIAAIDMCVVPTLTFDLLFAFLVQGHGRRQLLWFEVTRHPTAEWLARQITEAFPWASGPAYLVRDNDRAYGHVFTARVRAMGIRDRPISCGSPWQNGIAERLIGTLRRECLDQILIFGESHLRRILASYTAYYKLCQRLRIWHEALAIALRLQSALAVLAVERLQHAVVDCFGNSLIDLGRAIRRALGHHRMWHDRQSQPTGGLGDIAGTPSGLGDFVGVIRLGPPRETCT